MKTLKEVEWPQSFPLVSKEARELGYLIIEAMRTVPLKGVSGSLFLDALFFAAFLSALRQSGGQSHVLMSGFGALFAQSAEHPEFLEELRLVIHQKPN